MARVHTFNVTPSLPAKLQPLMELAYDLTWAWEPEIRRLFYRVDPTLWEEVNGNPVALLSRLDQDRIDALAEDEALMEHVARARRSVEDERRRRTWFARQHSKSGKDLLVAYFCAEFGLTEALPIYSGGLGVLAGDHLKSAAGVGAPLVAVGLLYQQGYFHQYLNEDGWQQEAPYENDFAMLPVRRARRPDGELASAQVHIEGRPVEVRVWEVHVGRVRLFLLDTNCPGNADQDREITAQLYGGGTELRFRQEIVLGIGGVRALRSLGVEPTVFHMNEGHSAFLALERIREVVTQQQMPFQAARELCASSNVFTTHTPVPAGFDIFTVEQLSALLPHIHDALGISRQQFLALGAHENDPGLHRGFNMAYLALRCSSGVNAVSQLHAVVSREMWRKLWPGMEASEVPITGITNGIHTRTWVASELAKLYDHYLGEVWRTETAEPATWADVDQIPDAELWRAHERGRERLVGFIRKRVARDRLKRGAPQPDVEAAGELFDPHALTIGFARRFATYKRANLLFRQPERLKALLTSPDRPIQLVFAGKAHPKDEPGKALIKEIVHFARDPEIRRRIIFLEEYDMGVARTMVHGVDVWLNNPRRPKEASGTSGMKVVPNGGLNLSVLDGWWAEGYAGDNGWAIGAGEVYEDVEAGDAIEADLLLDLLEDQVVPEFYDRRLDRLPRAWIARMKASIKGLTPMFATDRMVQDYVERLYLPAHRRSVAMSAKSAKGAHDLAARVERLRAAWGHVGVGDVQIDATQDVAIGDSVRVQASVQLAGLPPEDVVVEILGGRTDRHRQIVDGVLTPMSPKGEVDQGRLGYSGAWKPMHAGQSGCTIRLRPSFECNAPVRDFEVKTWE